MTAATEDLRTVTGNRPAGTAYTGLAGTGLAYPGLAPPGLAGPALAGPVLAGPVLMGPVLAGPVQAHRIFIRATSMEIWDALTRTQRQAVAWFPEKRDASGHVPSWKRWSADLKAPALRR
jgi:hypothetical protein